MNAATRIYLVQRNDTKEQRLVRAALRYHAERHVAQPLVSAKVASKDELVDLISKGVMVETARNGAVDDADEELPGIAG